MANVKVDVAERHSYVFESDDKIKRRWAYRAGMALCAILGRFYNFSIMGIHNVPRRGPAVIYGMHTTHNIDVPIFLAQGCRDTSRVVRALLHKTSYMFGHVTKLFGGVVGSRDVAVRLLQEGHLVGVIPGGLEETFHHMSGLGSRAYEVHWDSFWSGKPRAGVAAVAIAGGPGVKVLPCFVDGGEEMRWNPFFDAWTLLRLDRAWGALVRAAPRPLGDALLYVALFSWLGLSLLSVPVPGRATGHIGRPVEVREGETEEELSLRMRAEMQRLVWEVRGEGAVARDYARALRL